MRKLIFLTVLLISSHTGIAQNLVPNGGFELYSGCPNAGGGFWLEQLDSALFWMNPAPLIGSPDYFNQCTTGLLNVPNTNFGYQLAHGGGAFSGVTIFGAPLVPECREYVETPLISALLANACYHFEMYINLPNNFQYTTDAIQAYFSDTAITGITNFNPLPFTPQVSNATGMMPDYVNWTLVSGNFVANGGEQYLIIGNFSNDASTSTVLLNNAVQWPGTYFFIDDVSLTLCTGLDENNTSINVNIFPNPVTTELNVTVSSYDLSEIAIYDIVSRKLMQQEFSKSVSLNTERLAKGIYVYELKNKMGLIKKGKVIKE